MLVLKVATDGRVIVRNPAGQVIGEVTVCKSKDGWASLGFDFPKEISIRRQVVDQRLTAA
jgi:sRNA-binding carbon storage regulator CsrA